APSVRRARGHSLIAPAQRWYCADQLSARDHIGLRRPHDIERCRRGLEVEGGPAYREQAEVIVVRPMAFGRTRALVTGLAEIVSRLVETRGQPSGGIAGIETA